jgi:hypothetical protein
MIFCAVDEQKSTAAIIFTDTNTRTFCGGKKLSGGECNRPKNAIYAFDISCPFPMKFIPGRDQSPVG